MRLGLDIGTNSIGWWLYRLKADRPVAIIDSGVRIFSDGRKPKDKSSLAVDRRIARSARRRRDRFLRRRTVLMARLAAAGLMPADPNEAKKLELLDPYALRANGLIESLPLTHLGRALFHLNQRRGFKSNRKTDGGDNEAGKIKDATRRLDWAMAEAIKDESKRTYGAFLHQRRQNRPEKTPLEVRANKDGSRTDDRRTKSVRPRLTVAARDNAEKAEAGYDFYPDRRHLEDEFNKLWAAQAEFHPELTEPLRASLFETIFYQRPLKAPAVGRCLFLDEPRLAKAHPLTQQRVLYETVNNLRIVADGQAKRPLTLDQRDKILLALNQKKHTKSMSGMNLKLKALGRTLKLNPDESFTLETQTRDAIACDLVRASLSHPTRFGAHWSALDVDAQWALITRLRDEENRDALIIWLQAEYGLDAEHAAATADAPLPEGYGRIGETATRNILAHLKAEVLAYNEAVEKCGWHHSDNRTGEMLEDLPYYGKVLDRHVIPGSQEPADDDITRYGRITNPTVHIGLNQIRRLVNRIIEVYGKPDQIVVELARDLKNSEDQKKKINVEIKKNTAAAIKRGEKLVEELKQPDTGKNRMVLRLWEELGPDPMTRLCPYTGTRISAGMLFTGECDVDHILPYSRTMDDSFSNRTLCLREANREKRNKTPWEVWGNTPRWEGISANLKNLKPNKSWRFAADAMQQFEETKGFLDRQLVDTQYLSRIARQYLDTLFTEGGHVWVVPGRLTEMLRRHWGLNSLLPDHNRQAGKKKNRQDHRHHAIDAAVIAVTDRGLIQKIAKLTEDHVDQNREAFAETIDPPWGGFRDDVKASLDQIIVSHRADHGRIDPAARKAGKDTTAGQLHNDTAYGLTGEVNDKGAALVVTRKPIDSLTPAMIAKIRDPDLKRMLGVATKGRDGKDFDAAIQTFAAKPGPYQGIRRVRIIEPVKTVAIKDREGRDYKSYKPGDNHCYEVWRLPDGSFTSQIISTFDAHQGNEASRPHPAAKRIMRLQKSDMVALEDSKVGPVIACVAKFDTNGTIVLVPHTESNADERYSTSNKAHKNNPEIKIDDVYIRLRPSTLMQNGARRIYVNEIGHVRDAGPYNKR